MTSMTLDHLLLRPTSRSLRSPDRLLTSVQMVDRQMWQSMTPLRQFKKLGADAAVKSLEKKGFAWERLHDLGPAELGELVRNPGVRLCVEGIRLFLQEWLPA